MLSVRRVVTGLAAFLLALGGAQVGAAHHLATRPAPIVLTAARPAGPPVYAIPDIIRPVAHPADVAAREAGFAADRRRMAQWAVDGERARVEAGERVEAARQEAEALEVARRRTRSVAPRANHEDESPPLGGHSAGGNTSGVSIQCESGGDYSSNTGNGYYGAYQFDRQTWHAAGGSTDTANQASPAEQDAVAAGWVAAGHRDAWPNC